MQVDRPWNRVVTDPELRRFLHEKLAIIQSEYAPDHIILFGSRARGEARPESDIDLILVSGRFRGTKFINRMGRFLQAVRPHRHVDAICYTPEEFEERRQQVPMIAEACETGVWL